MKILYAIQGTGNGHLSRARDVVPLLKERAYVEVLVSAWKVKKDLPFDIDYVCKGLGFTFGKKGGVDLWDTWKKADLKAFWKEVRAIPIHNYDLLISDFEPVSAWAAKKARLPCIALSHQAAVINKYAPKPKKTDLVGQQILQHFAPATDSYGFHFEAYDSQIFTPVIRKEVREQEVLNKGHYTVYLPAYSIEKLMAKLAGFRSTEWQVFSPKAKIPYREGNIHVFPTDNAAFIKSMAESEGVLCGAGFETPAESLFLGKKLMVIPMRTQYEQQCNAAALTQMGVPVLKNLKKKRLPCLEAWLNSQERIAVNYPDHLGNIIDELLLKHKKVQTKVYR
ncbi:MAG: glycosyltransferase family protein [Bacteroidota bacterium]